MSSLEYPGHQLLSTQPAKIAHKRALLYRLVYALYGLTEEEIKVEGKG